MTILPVRRSTPRSKSKHNHPTYLHSLDRRNPYLGQRLALVPDNLVRAAYRLRLNQSFQGGLSPEDLSWLSAHNGRFAYFAHPNLPRIETLYKNRKLGEETMDEFISRFNSSPPDSSSCNPYIIGISPRYGGCKAQTQDNYEGMLHKLWNFLALIGSNEAYEAMLILLINKPSRALYPSIPLEFILACLDHQFMPFGSECRLDGQPIQDAERNRVLCAEEIASPKILSYIFLP